MTPGEYFKLSREEKAFIVAAIKIKNDRENKK